MTAAARATSAVELQGSSGCGLGRAPHLGQEMRGLVLTVTASCVISRHFKLCLSVHTCRAGVCMTKGKGLLLGFLVEPCVASPLRNCLCPGFVISQDQPGLGMPPPTPWAPPLVPLMIRE